MTTRAEHIAWMKERALVELAEDGPKAALKSVLSDLSKHQETNNPAFVLRTQAKIQEASAGIVDAAQVRRFIEGFN